MAIIEYIPLRTLWGNFNSYQADSESLSAPGMVDLPIEDD